MEVEIKAEIAKNVRPNNPVHQRTQALLEALTSVIKDQGTSLSGTAYFALIMTSLEKILTSGASPSNRNTNEDEMEDDEEDGGGEDELSLSSTIMLLFYVLPRVPVAVLRSKLMDICQVFLRLFELYSSTQNKQLTRTFIQCIDKLLETQKDPSVWSQQHVVSLAQIVLTFSLDKSKVRKEAIAACYGIFSSCPEVARKTLSLTFQNFVLSILQRQSNIASNEAQQGTLHALQLLRYTIPFATKPTIVALGDAILKLPVATQPYVVVMIFQCFESLFDPKSIPSTQFLKGESSSQVNNEEKEATELPQDVTSKYIQKLFEIQPSTKDVELNMAFTTMITKGILLLARTNITTVTKHLPQYFENLMPNFLHSETNFTATTANCFKDVIQHAIDQQLVTLTVAGASSGVAKNTDTALERLIATLEGGLRYPYRASWTVILQVQAALFNRLGTHSFPLLVTLLKSLGEIHATQELHTGELLYSLGLAFGSAVAAMGPKRFLQVLPLNIVEDVVPDRSWLLPLFADHITNTELRFFAEYFMPLALQLKSKWKIATQQGSKVDAKSSEVMYHQIWNLFPAFCNRPTDTAESFKHIAKQLGSALQDESDLRKPICGGLSNLIQSNRDITNPSAASQAEKDYVVPSASDVENAKKSLAAVAGFSKNFLPILFNLFSLKTLPAEMRVEVHKAISAFLAITDPKGVQSFFKTVMTKLLAIPVIKKQEEKKPNNNNDDVEMDAAAKAPKVSQDNIFLKGYLTELSTSFVPYLDEENLNNLYKALKNQTEEPEVSIQKKSFKAIAHICQHQQFAKKNLSDIQAVLLNPNIKMAPSIVRPRLCCFRAVLSQLDLSAVTSTPQNQITQVTKKFLSEILLSLKEKNIKARNEAFEIILMIADKMYGKENSTDFFGMVVAGLAGATPRMTSATVMALGRLLIHHKSTLSPDFAQALIKPIVILLNSNNKEIIKACLGFIIVTLKTFGGVAVEPHLQPLMTSLSEMNKDTKHSFRVEMKKIFSKLISKLGYQSVVTFVPETDQKLLKYVKKEIERKQKKKKPEGEGQKTRKEVKAKKGNAETLEDILYGSDNDEHNDMDEGKGKKSKSFIVEDNDEVLDLLDPKSIKNVLSADPSKGKVRPNLPNFEVSEDGKLVIRDEFDRVKPVRRKSAAREMEEMLLEEEKSYDNKMNKKRKRVAGVGEMDSEDEAETASGALIKRAMDRMEEDVSSNNNNNNSKGPLVKKQAKKPKTEPQLGQQYKSARARGDMLKPDKPLPFAYLPLDKQLLNKRTKNRAKAQLKSVVNAAKRGAQVKPQRKKNLGLSRSTNRNHGDSEQHRRPDTHRQQTNNRPSWMHI